MTKDLEQLLIRVNLLNNEEINEDVRWDVIDTLNNHLKQLRIGDVSQQRELLKDKDKLVFKLIKLNNGYYEAMQRELTIEAVYLRDEIVRLQEEILNL